MNIPQVLIAGKLLSEKQANLVKSSTHANFLRLHYRLHDESINADWPVEPSQRDIDDYLMYVEILYLFNPEYLEKIFKPKHLFTINGGKATANFTLDDCIQIHHRKHQKWKMSKPHTSN